MMHDVEVGNQDGSIGRSLAGSKTGMDAKLYCNISSARYLEQAQDFVRVDAQMPHVRRSMMYVCDTYE